MLILREITPLEKTKELLTSQVDGIKTLFTTTNNYILGTLEVYINGQLVINTIDYNEVSTNSFEFTLPIKLGADIEVKYREV